MSVEVDIKITDKDMYRFNLFHAYTGFQGVFATVIGLAVLAVACFTIKKVDITYTLLYFLFGVIFLIYTPISLRLRAKRRIMMSPILKETLHYNIDETGIHVSVGEQNADLEWNMIYKMVATKSNLLIYSTPVYAYVIPLKQLADKYKAVRMLAEHNLEKYRLRMR